MSSQNHHQSPESDAVVPTNRAARRAKRKGKAMPDQVQTSRKNDVRGSQVMAQPRVKGRRGNK